MSRSYFDHQTPLGTLLAELRAHDGFRSNAAATELRRRGEPGGVLTAEALLDALTNDDTVIRVAALDALHALGARAPTNGLLLLVTHDQHERVRIAALNILRDAGAPPPASILIPLLSDSTPRIRTVALALLGPQTPDDTLAVLLGDPDPAMRNSALSLATQRPMATHALLAALDDSDATVRDEAARLAAERSESALDGAIVTMALKHLHVTDARERYATVGTLNYLGARAPLEPLIEATFDVDPYVRVAAIWGLQRLMSHDSRQRVRAMLHDPEFRVRRMAAKGLACEGDVDAITELVEQLHGANEWERENVLSLLTDANDLPARRAIARQLPTEALLHMLRDPWWPVGYMARELFGDLGDDAPIGELLALLHDGDDVTRLVAACALKALGTRVPMDALLAALDDPHYRVRGEVAAALEAFGALVPVERLLPHLHPGDEQVAGAVARLGRQEGIDGLAMALRHVYSNVNAASTCTRLGASIPVEALFDALGDSNNSVRRWSAEALVAGRPDTLEALAPDLLDIAMGARLPQSRATQVLESLRQTEILVALMRLDYADPALLEWVTERLDWPFWETRMRAVQVTSALYQSAGEPFPAPIIEKIAALRGDRYSLSVRVVAREALAAPDEEVSWDGD